MMTDSNARVRASYEDYHNSIANISDSLLEGYVLWFRNSRDLEDLATRLATNLGDHRDVILDAYKTVKRERRIDETAFYTMDDAPSSSIEIAEAALLKKRIALQERREAIGNSARKALAVPGPFERSRRDILMNR